MRTLLVDGNNVLARADHASRGKGVQMSVGEIQTASLVIFINLLSKYVRQVEPTHMAVFWDAGHTYRDRIYPAYKANRKKPMSDIYEPVAFYLAKEFLTWAGVPHKAHTGWEADDLIAATARQTYGKVVILSGDKDLLQLVTPRHLAGPLVDGLPERWQEVVQIRVGTGDVEWTEHHVEAKFGVPPHHLSHYLALVGDASDGVPGVAGIGPKKALALLEKAEWDWEATLVLLGPEEAAQAVLMHSLVDLRTFDYDEAFMAANARAPAFNPIVPNSDSASWQALMGFCDKYRLESLRGRLEAGTLWRDSFSVEQLFLDVDTL